MKNNKSFHSNHNASMQNFSNIKVNSNLNTNKSIRGGYVSTNFGLGKTSSNLKQFVSFFSKLTTRSCLNFVE
jgi:hypothetical protein